MCDAAPRSGPVAGAGPTLGVSDSDSRGVPGYHSILHPDLLDVSWPQTGTPP